MTLISYPIRSIGVQCNTSGSPGRTIEDHKNIHIEYSSKLQYFNTLRGYAYYVSFIDDLSAGLTVPYFVKLCLEGGVLLHVLGKVSGYFGWRVPLEA